MKHWLPTRAGMWGLTQGQRNGNADVVAPPQNVSRSLSIKPVNGTCFQNRVLKVISK